MALLNFFRQRGNPGALVYITDENGAANTGAVIPAMTLVDQTGAAVASGSSASPTVAKSQGGSLATGQASAGTSATVIAAARSTRGSITIVNGGTTDVFIGGSGVTATTGILLTGTKGASITLNTTAAVYGVVAAGTQTVSFAETY